MASFYPENISVDLPTTPEWRCLPFWVRSDLTEFVHSGYLEPETTVHAALCNDFVRTVCMAGDDVRPLLRELAVSIYNYLPGGCHGSPARVAAWAAAGGLRGMAAAAAGAVQAGAGARV